MLASDHVVAEALLRNNSASILSARAIKKMKRKPKNKILRVLLD